VANDVKDANDPNDASDPNNLTTGVPAVPRRQWKVWLIGGGILVVAAVVIGSAIGAVLGTRQSGPLASQGGVTGRPTIVVAPAVAGAPSVVPSPSAASAPTPATAQAAEASTEYVVQPGDTLRTIAEQHYGDPGMWPRIYDANRDVIGPDPDALQAGTTLHLPAQ
jgi:nucleoid-associated protein YgaU